MKRFTCDCISANLLALMAANSGSSSMFFPVICLLLTKMIHFIEFCLETAVIFLEIMCQSFPYRGDKGSQLPQAKLIKTLFLHFLLLKRLCD